jgi:hypothetical protein
LCVSTKKKRHIEIFVRKHKKEMAGRVRVEPSSRLGQLIKEFLKDKYLPSTGKDIEAALQLFREHLAEKGIEGISDLDLNDQKDRHTLAFWAILTSEGDLRAGWDQFLRSKEVADIEQLVEKASEVVAIEEIKQVSGEEEEEEGKRQKLIDNLTGQLAENTRIIAELERYPADQLNVGQQNDLRLAQAKRDIITNALRNPETLDFLAGYAEPSLPPEFLSFLEKEASKEEEAEEEEEKEGVAKKVQPLGVLEFPSLLGIESKESELNAAAAAAAGPTFSKKIESGHKFATDEELAKMSPAERSMLNILTLAADKLKQSSGIEEKAGSRGKLVNIRPHPLAGRSKTLAGRSKTLAGRSKTADRFSSFEHLSPEERANLAVAVLEKAIEIKKEQEKEVGLEKKDVSATGISKGMSRVAGTALDVKDLINEHNERVLRETILPKLGLEAKTGSSGLLQGKSSTAVLQGKSFTAAGPPYFESGSLVEATELLAREVQTPLLPTFQFKQDKSGETLLVHFGKKEIKNSKAQANNIVQVFAKMWASPEIYNAFNAAPQEVVFQDHLGKILARQEVGLLSKESSLAKHSLTMSGSTSKGGMKLQPVKATSWHTGTSHGTCSFCEKSWKECQCGGF